MKCYYHPPVDGVALCKACNRALCHDCCTDVPPGTACKGRCEDEVAALNIMIERGKSAYQKTGKAYKVNAFFMISGGLFPFVLGLIPILRGEGIGSIFFVIIGIVFLLWGYFSFRSGKQIQQVD